MQLQALGESPNRLKKLKNYPNVTDQMQKGKKRASIHKTLLYSLLAKVQGHGI
jgi:hypothetical protein